LLVAISAFTASIRAASVADRQNHHIPRIFGGQLCGSEVVLRRNIVLQRGQIEQSLRQVRPEVDCLKRPDDRLETGKLQPVGREVHLLHLDRHIASDGWQQRLQLLQLLPVGVLLRGRLQDQAKVGAQTALDRVVEGKVDHCPGCIPGHQRTLEGVLRGVRAILSRAGLQ
jgi:hypothetical protein